MINIIEAYSNLVKNICKKFIIKVLEFPKIL
jgi:hypothetical protein